MQQKTTHRTIGVVGGGTMGVGIAYVYAVAGGLTTVVEPDDARAATMRLTIKTAAQSAVRRGKLSAERAGQIPNEIARVRGAGELPMGLDLVVETVPERLEVKRQVLAQIEAREPAIIASNTSALSIDTLAAPMRDPGSFLGMHFFNPVWSLPMVELIRGAQTTDTTLQLARTYAEITGKQTITVRDVPGFATSRLDLIA
jgi:3-hydroxybutyryl-CoA dehydrogenase